MTELKTKARFCPSPTGLLHLGNARTALFNGLFSKSVALQGGRGALLLRIEDTDEARSKPEFTEALQADLRWLELQWQEGPGCEVQGQGPYWQSQRQAIYQKYHEQLRAAGWSYPCFCSEEQLELTRKIQRMAGKPPRYAGTCKPLSTEEVQARLAQGQTPTYRFRVPEGQCIEFVDLIRGPQVFQSDDLGDFVICRGDGTFPFMFSNAIDDSLMEVTHALRGEDHVANTPRQLLILTALRLPAPQYGHFNLIVGPDGSPLSKRHGSKSIAELRALGYLPGAIQNYLARLGHYYAEDDYFSLEQLAQRFRLDHLGRAPAKFNQEQLDHWQQRAVHQLGDAAFFEWMDPVTVQKIPEAARTLFVATLKNNVLFPEDVRRWVQVLFGEFPAWEGAQQTLLLKTGAAFFKLLQQVLATEGPGVAAMAAAVQAQLGLKGKAFFGPLRIALTAMDHGPALQPILDLQGAARVAALLQRCVDLF